MSSKIQSNPVLIQSLLEQHTPITFRAGGPSMTPTIRDGDCVTVRPLQPGDLRPGAILLYRKHGRLILHRLVRTGTPLTFCGDAAPGITESIDAADILGTATAVKHSEKTRALNTPSHRLCGRLRCALKRTLKI